MRYSFQANVAGMTRRAPACSQIRPASLSPSTSRPRSAAEASYSIAGPDRVGATRPGVVVVEGLWWHRFHPGGHGANVLTRDDVTDLGGGPAFHSNLVQVARAESAPAGSALAGPD